MTSPKPNLMPKAKGEKRRESCITNAVLHSFLHSFMPLFPTSVGPLNLLYQNLIHSKWHFLVLVFYAYLKTLRSAINYRRIYCSVNFLLYLSGQWRLLRCFREFGNVGSVRKGIFAGKRGQCLVASSTLDMDG
jgi:hypothetical protein